MFRKFNILLLTGCSLLACQTKDTPHDKDLFDQENLIAWCVVPFDSVKRTPAQRAEMLKDLGFRHFAYDWRAEHLASFAEELKALTAAGVGLDAVWLWVQPDSTSMWDATTEQVLTLLETHGVKTRLWVGFDNRYFSELSDSARLEKAVASVVALDDRAKAMGCRISLYNHGDWFGDPENQVVIIQQTGRDDIGIVYNFHHAHEQVDAFPGLLTKMLPYLTTVNINGMQLDGPKILPVGSGNREAEMLRQLKNSGYQGLIGILGHVEDADIKTILQQNLNGLEELAAGL